jgi:hypothetical protein
MFCSQCGKKVADDAKFCPECGATIGGVGAKVGSSASGPSIPQTTAPAKAIDRSAQSAGYAIVIAGIGWVAGALLNILLFVNILGFLLTAAVAAVSWYAYKEVREGNLGTAKTTSLVAAAASALLIVLSVVFASYLGIIIGVIATIALFYAFTQIKVS